MDILFVLRWIDLRMILMVSICLVIQSNFSFKFFLVMSLLFSPSWLLTSGV